MEEFNGVDVGKSGPSLPSHLISFQIFYYWVKVKQCKVSQLKVSHLCYINFCFKISFHSSKVFYIQYPVSYILFLALVYFII